MRNFLNEKEYCEIFKLLVEKGNGKSANMLAQKLSTKQQNSIENETKRISRRLKKMNQAGFLKYTKGKLYNEKFYSINYDKLQFIFFNFLNKKYHAPTKFIPPINNTKYRVFFKLKEFLKQKFENDSNLRKLNTIGRIFELIAETGIGYFFNKMEFDIKENGFTISFDSEKQNMKYWAIMNWLLAIYINYFGENWKKRFNIKQPVTEIY